MSRFSTRSLKSELIDAPGIPYDHWETCLRELNTVNTFLGGHHITLSGIQAISNSDKLTIAEIGCGGGDNLKAIHFHKPGFHFIGIDINKSCIDFAAKQCLAFSSILFICSDYKKVNFGELRPDIIFSSLFCHHFSDDQLVEMLVWLNQNALKGFFINDLQRHPLAYHSIKLLTRLFSGSYLVKNDAPLSVLRGFRKKEWQVLLKRAGITKYTIRWRWAFRYLIVVTNE